MADSAAAATGDGGNAYALAVDAEGFRLFDRSSGSARPLRFGADTATVIAALERALGATPERGTNTECGAGAMDAATWPNGYTVLSQEGRFVGWSTDGRDVGPAVTTAAGVGPGSTRHELEAAYAAEFSETSLGTEFAAGGLYGVLDGAGANARITHMWGGTSCVFR